MAPVMRVGDDSRCLLHRCFEEQARRTPDSVALWCNDQPVRFAELDAASGRVARALSARGLGEGSHIGLHMERSADYYAAMLGILKVGGAVVPLPPSYPAGRLGDILAYSRLDVVIDADGTRLPSTERDRVVGFAELQAEAGSSFESVAVRPDRAAFVLCSSGSTGKPKMIVRSHQSFFHRLNWTWANWPYREGEVCCQKSHMTTTHAIYELFEPLLRGVPVHVIPDDVVRHVERFWDTIRSKRISRLLIVPSLLQVSLDMPGFAAPPIRVLVLMGEYVHPQLARRVIESFPPETKIFSIYGSTEASSTLVCDLRESWRPGEELPLGKPISPEIRAVVIGPGGAPVAAGESGLLHIAGPALFAGYFRDPELTDSVLIRSGSDGADLFNSNDQVRLLPDRNLQYVGRVDHTVKVRGYRVDLGEVERAILAQPEIRQAVVILGEAGDNPPLVAFYTPGTVDHAALLGALRHRLPAYMLPSILVGLESFPLTSSGKVDRRKLLEDFARRATATVSDESLSNTEARVVEAWRHVLGHGEIRRDSNFFEVGGTSLSVFAAVQRLRDAFGLDRRQLSDHSFYQFPTPLELAGYIDGLKAGIAPAAAAKPAVAVTLRRGEPARPPLFVIASSGGTLGAYDRLSKVLKTSREIVGIRDPFVWGGREPTIGFQDWISIYVGAIRERQPQGPYTVCAFSSAGAFGYEVAQRLRQEGQEVAQLILIDPIGIAGEAEEDFGYRVFRALFGSRRSKLLVRLAGWWRLLSGVGPRASVAAGANDFAMTRAEYEQRAAAVRRDMKVMKDLSSLFELNTGLPYTMTDADFAGMAPEQYLAAFLARVKAVTPDVDPETVERILIQYYCLQLSATHFYRLKCYEGQVEILEPEGPQVGLLGAYFRPYVRNLRMRVLPIGAPSERTRFVCENLSRSLRTHYRSMRDDTFVAHLAAALEPLL